MLTLKVREKEFKIGLVNNYIHQLYSDMQSMTTDIQEAAEEMEELRKDFVEDSQELLKDRKALRELKKKYLQDRKDARLELKELSVKLVGLRDEMLKELCVSNGYEFDQKWWTHKTSVDDINNFIIDCIRKDLKDTANKKKEK